MIYVDRDCCTKTGDPPILRLFSPWTTAVRLDIFHYMRRFNKGLRGESHPLYQQFCSELSCCIFEWNSNDLDHLREAKLSQLQRSHPDQNISQNDVSASLTSTELVQHCRRRTRGPDETRQRIQMLLEKMWDLEDNTGKRLINPNAMNNIWTEQQRHSNASRMYQELICTPRMAPL